VPSAQALVKTLAESFPLSGHKSIVLAVSSDKQYPEMLRILAGYFDHFYLTKYGNNPRSVPLEKLAETLHAIDPSKPFSIHSTSETVLRATRQAEPGEGLICITGSVFLAGELRPLLVQPTAP
jgi:dihydrofolate synthase/folylpolyglutamate synthase